MDKRMLKMIDSPMIPSMALTGDFSVEYDFSLLNVDINILTWVNFLLSDGHLEKGHLKFDKVMGTSFYKPSSPSLDC